MWFDNEDFGERRFIDGTWVGKAVRISIYNCFFDFESECEPVTIVTCSQFAKSLRCRQLLGIGCKNPFLYIGNNSLHCRPHHLSLELWQVLL